MALNSLSNKKDAAVEFIKYSVSPEAQSLNFQEFTNFPSRLSVAKQVVAAARGQQAEWLAQLETTIATGKEWPKLPGFSKVCTRHIQGDREGAEQPGLAEDALNRSGEGIA